MKSKYGFTLVEIMIVIAIISILAAIAIPNILQAKERREHPSRFDKNGHRIEKNHISAEEVETSDAVESPFVNEKDTEYLKVGKFSYNGHTIIRFNSISNREWGMHDPDCPKCKK